VNRHCRRVRNPVEALEEATEQALDAAERPSAFAPCGFRSTAARAGDKVRELNADMTVEIAMVKAELPVELAAEPLTKATGTNTAHRRA